MFVYFFSGKNKSFWLVLIIEMCFSPKLRTSLKLYFLKIWISREIKIVIFPFPWGQMRWSERMKTKNSKNWKKETKKIEKKKKIEKLSFAMPIGFLHQLNLIHWKRMTLSLFIEKVVFFRIELPKLIYGQFYSNNIWQWEIHVSFRENDYTIRNGLR